MKIFNIHQTIPFWSIFQPRFIQRLFFLHITISVFRLRFAMDVVGPRGIDYHGLPSQNYNGTGGGWFTLNTRNPNYSFRPKIDEKKKTISCFDFTSYAIFFKCVWFSMLRFPRICNLPAIFAGNDRYLRKTRNNSRTLVHGSFIHELLYGRTWETVKYKVNIF